MLAILRIIKVWLRSDLVFNFLHKKELMKMEKTLHSFSEAPLKVNSFLIIKTCYIVVYAYTSVVEELLNRFDFFHFTNMCSLEMV